MEALTFLQWGFDALLAAGLLWLAWNTLFHSDLFNSIIFFIAFGLLMALAWVRLDAPDVALAEAAIGAGLTGAILLTGLARLRNLVADEGDLISTNQAAPRKRLRKRLAAILMLWVAVVLVYTISLMPSLDTELNIAVFTNLEASGVSNPVTAVLLNFRSYDTLLEMMVLLLALLGVRSVGSLTHQKEPSSGLVLHSLAGLAIPILILISAYLLWAGAHKPGGAFQAGAVLGAAGVLLILAGRRLRPSLMRLPLRITVVTGASVFIAIAVITLLMGQHLLQYPTPHSSGLILLIESAATVSIGVTLTALFMGILPDNKDTP